MLSISWKEARKHQTNLSLSKSTFGFTKDKRFKGKDSALYRIYHLDVTPSIIYPLSLAKHPPQESEKDLKYP